MCNNLILKKADIDNNILNNKKKNIQSAKILKTKYQNVQFIVNSIILKSALTL